MKQDGGVGSQTVDRAISVLNAVVAANEAVTLDRLASTTGFHRSNVYRLLRSLEAGGYVGRDEGMGGYAIGPRLLAHSVSIAQRYDLGSSLRPAMDAIVSDFGETVSLHLRSGDQRVCVEVAEGTHPIRRMIPLGEAHPVYVGETGRALMSAMSDTDLDKVVQKAVIAGHDPRTLRNDIEQSRKHGYFCGIGVRTTEVGAISIPMTGIDGSLFALTVSGPASRWDIATMHIAAPKIIEHLRPIKNQLVNQTSTGPHIV